MPVGDGFEKIRRNFTLKMEEKFNLFKREATHSFTKKKEDFEYFSITTGTAPNLKNPTGTFTIEIYSTDDLS